MAEKTAQQPTKQQILDEMKRGTEKKPEVKKPEPPKKDKVPEKKAPVQEKKKIQPQKTTNWDDERIEKTLNNAIKKAKYDGNKDELAKELGMTKENLVRKLSDFHKAIKGKGINVDVVMEDRINALVAVAMGKEDTVGKTRPFEKDGSRDTARDGWNNQFEGTGLVLEDAKGKGGRSAYALSYTKVEKRAAPAQAKEEEKKEYAPAAAEKKDDEAERRKNEEEAVALERKQAVNDATKQFAEMKNQLRDKEPTIEKNSSLWNLVPGVNTWNAISGEYNGDPWYVQVIRAIPIIGNIYNIFSTPKKKVVPERMSEEDKTRVMNNMLKALNDKNARLKIRFSVDNGELVSEQY